MTPHVFEDRQTIQICETLTRYIFQIRREPEQISLRSGVAARVIWFGLRRQVSRRRASEQAGPRAWAWAQDARRPCSAKRSQGLSEANPSRSLRHLAVRGSKFVGRESLVAGRHS